MNKLILAVLLLTAGNALCSENKIDFLEKQLIGRLMNEFDGRLMESDIEFMNPFIKAFAKARATSEAFKFFACPEVNEDIERESMAFQDALINCLHKHLECIFNWSDNPDEEQKSRFGFALIFLFEAQQQLKASIEAVKRFIPNLDVEHEMEVLTELIDEANVAYEENMIG